MRERGISLIALIITIIVIIILAAISIAGVSGMVERSRYAKFCGDLDAVQDAVSQAYGTKRIKEAQNPDGLKTSEEIYKWVATGGVDGNLEKAKGPNGQDLYKLADDSVLGLDLPKYGDSDWGVDPKTGEVFLVDGFEYDNHMYYSKTDVQNGGKEKDEDGGGEETDDDWAEFHQVITVDVPSGAIPVVYDQEKQAWKKADTSTHWYDYRSDTNAHQWANVVTVGKGKSYAVDEIIPEDDILGMFVYIPRYAYQITRGYHSNDTGEIKIAFINQSNQDKDGKTYVTTYPGAENGAMKDYVVHPAFTNDSSIGGWNKNLNGFWVAKFEAGGDKEHITFKPDMPSINNIDISTIVSASKQIAQAQNVSSSNTHLIKNSEWGAIAYLTQSEYGNTNIWNNPCEVTGMAGSLPDANNTPLEECNAYDTPKGQQSSSTGNVYGVYDLTGGMTEYVAAYIENDYGKEYENLFVDAHLENKYNIGLKDETSANYEANNGKWGDAMWEISNSANGYAGCWNKDYSYFPNTGYPFFVRGGDYVGGSKSGVFTFNSNTGDGRNALGFRVALVP